MPETVDTQVQEPVQENASAVDPNDTLYAELDRLSFGEEPTGDELEEEVESELPEDAVGEEEEPSESDAETEDSEEATETQTEPEVEETVETESVETEVEEDDFAPLKAAGYKGDSLLSLIQIVQSNPEVQAALERAINGVPAPEQKQVEVSEEKTPQDFMPEGKSYSSMDAMEPGTESYKAFQKHVRYVSAQEYQSQTEAQSKAYQEQVARQRQTESLHNGKKNLMDKYGVSEKEIQSFGEKLAQTPNLNQLEVAYLGVNFEALVAKRVEEAVQKEADKRAEQIVRSKHNGKVKSSVIADTGTTKPLQKVDDDIYAKIGNSMFE